jgi:hypothetical protein
MQIKPNSFSIVVVGRWNPYILTPQWITQHLFDNAPPVQIEFSLNLDLPNRFKVHNVIITPTPEKVIITSVDDNAESLTQIGTVATKLCSILEHTPLIAIGINFGYIEKEDKSELLSNLDFDKNDPFSEDGWRINSHLVKRFIVKDHYKLNFTLTLDDNDDFHFDFNYNYVITPKELAGKTSREYIEDLLKGNGVISFYENSKELLNNVYNLKLQNND